MRPITNQRFNAFAAYCRSPQALAMADEVLWYEAEESRIMAAIIRERVDGEYGGIILGRDEKERYRWINGTEFFKSKIQARVALRAKINKIIPIFEQHRKQGDNDQKPVDFFTPLQKTKQPLNQSFLNLTKLEGYSPAKEIIEPMMRWHEDADGNFVEQFQTTGFDSRIWELYLFSLFTEAGLLIDKSNATPDFTCAGLTGTFCAEATTVNPSRDKKGNIVPPPPIDTEDEYEAALRDYFPIKFAGPLTEKLKKRYWEKENVQGKPFILAIQDFQTPIAMTLTRNALPTYLYGYRQANDWTPDNPIFERIETHKWGTKVINSNFFSFEGAEYISAVIFNPSATISKFNRIGLQAGFGSDQVKLFRFGTACKRRNGNTEIAEYAYSVWEGSHTETWIEGLEVFHNPRALHPLPKEILPGAAHHFMEENGEMKSWLPAWHPIQSYTKIGIGQLPPQPDDGEPF
ncbi:TPA: hypothetical protein ACKP6A_002331 [Pseudomonas aeruginosa]|uniref:hypothetical protein n=1 Tax=Pseudomonas aeruginosa TaxID=287 RepID=UPI0003B96256|nr:hypothetical protein [Pseudomonas aeruginosa]ERY84286.1 hypothetical protein Q028_00886 [Pseudomonas aeruginosa BWHPSA015]MBA4919730.1 hypothetical protein [Pseudomonas aeruginosa]MBA5118292.1 hypothetical protein [Pseudomonas aeruginosa]MBG5504026.1 hypothetical protein [Pseudomonas aeruginosa]MBH4039796.1 hypothetical protein [Pseudomonas aeruginosa]